MIDAEDYRIWLAEEFRHAIDRFREDIIDHDPLQGICVVDITMGDNTFSAVITFPLDGTLSAQNPPSLEFTAKTNLSVGQRTGIKSIARSAAVNALMDGQYCLLPILERIHGTLLVFQQEDVSLSKESGIKVDSVRSSRTHMGKSISPDLNHAMKDQDDFYSFEHRINSSTSLKSIGRQREMTGSTKPSKPSSSAVFKSTTIRHATYELDNRVPFPRTAGACFSGTDRLVVFNSLGVHGERSTYAATAPRPRSLDQFYDYIKHMALAPVRTPFHMPVSAENESGSPSIKSLGLYTPLDDEPVDDIFNLQSYFTTSKRSTGMLASKRKRGIARFPINVWVDVINVRSISNLSLSLAIAYKLTGTDAIAICQSNAEAAKERGFVDKEEMWKVMGMAIATGMQTEKSTKIIPRSAAAVWRQHPLGLPMVKRCLQHFELARDVQSVASLIAVFELAFDNSNIMSVSFSQTYVREIRLYAEILYRWSLLIKRAELLRSTDTQLKERRRATATSSLGSISASLSNGPYTSRASSAGVGSSPSAQMLCQNCNFALGSGSWGACPYCHTTTGLVCSICRLAIKGIATVCLDCGHAGHTQHMLRWFQKQSRCPKGCGCNCSRMVGGGTKTDRIRA